LAKVKLRVKLAGQWTAYYDFSIAGKFIFPTRPKAIFRFVINQDKKLEMEFDPTDSILFNDVDENISQISLRNIESNKYALMYYFNSKRKLKNDITESIEP
jgi:hypothetical protein